MMKAMVLTRLGPLEPGHDALEFVDRPVPTPGDDEVLIRVSACGVCHTELDIIEGRTPPPRLPMIPGHQIVGRVVAVGPQARELTVGDRVGVAWIHSACGECDHCRAGRENLCAGFVATGRDVDGGYAEYTVVKAAFAHPIPAALTDSQAAPMLCAGAVGFRALDQVGLRDGQSLGLVGFGASAHLVLQAATLLYPSGRVYVFARSAAQRQLALELGASWVGDITDRPPEPLAGAIDTTPAWRPILQALKHLAPGGRLVINAIRKESGDQAALAELDYAEHLWMEKDVRSVANVTRHDVRAFLDLAARFNIRPEVRDYPLSEANRALHDLRSSASRGARVLRME